MSSEKLSAILNDLNSSSADIEASAVLSTDGLMMSSLLTADMDEDRVGAMSATMLSLADRIATELARGSLEEVLIKGKLGYILMTHAGSDAVITVLTKPEARLGLISLDVKRAADAIKKIVT